MILEEKMKTKFNLGGAREDRILLNGQFTSCEMWRGALERVFSDVSKDLPLNIQCKEVQKY